MPSGTPRTSARASRAPATGKQAHGPGRRLHGAIAQKLGVAIVSGHYAPGETLPGEVAFSEELNVSRSAYREAVQVLTAKGLVESRPKAGTRVLPRRRWNLLDPGRAGMGLRGRTGCVVRGATCSSCARSSSRLPPAWPQSGATSTTSRRMKASLAAMRRHTLATDQGRAADRDFHRAILAATKNEALHVLGAGIGAAVTWTTHFKQRARALPRNPIPDHARVYDAIAAGQVTAAVEAMRTLVQLARADTSGLTGGGS